MAPWTQTENCRINLPVFFESSSSEDTFSLGKRLSPLLKKGSIVALKGPLGAGKTCFAKGIAVGLGVEEEVTSPTYTIVSEYEGFLCDKNGTEAREPITIFHIDAYRLRGKDDFTAIGGEDIIFGNGISVIEWSERICDFIPPGALRVDFEIKEDGKRTVHIYMADNK